MREDGGRARLSRLEPDTSCWNHLSWRCFVRGAFDIEMLEVRLAERGIAVHCRHAALRLFRHPDGHEIALVLTTGRVQLRVDIGQAEDGRAQVARALHLTLGEALGLRDSEKGIEGGRCHADPSTVGG